MRFSFYVNRLNKLLYESINLNETLSGPNIEMWYTVFLLTINITAGQKLLPYF